MDYDFARFANLHGCVPASATISGIVPTPDLKTLGANDLARLCIDRASADAWYQFVARFQKPIALVILRTCRKWGSASPGVIDDLVQETFLRLCTDECKLLKSFVARETDSVIGLLKVIAINVTHDHFRAETTQKRGGLLHRVESEWVDRDLLEALPDRTNPAEKEIQLAEIDRALHACVPDVLTERDCAIFWLYFEQGLTARDIASIAAMGLTVKGVESSIHRSTRQLRERLQRPVAVGAVKGISGVSTILKENR